jgi:parvulin-like peptidyl-prolyl isomerase
MSKRAIKMAAMAGTVGLLGTVAAACGSQTAVAKPLAVINGQALTKADWQIAVNATDMLQGVSMATTKAAEKQQVKQLATEVAVEQYALKQHWITKAKATSEAKLFVKQNATAALGGTTKKMEAALKKKHLSVATFTQFMVQQMELQAAFAQATKGLKPVTKAEALSYYNQNKASFPQAAQDKMRMILVKTKPLALTIEKELKAGGSWTILAKKYSGDPASKNKGGEYGWVNTGSASGYVPGFYNEMDKLKAGQYGIGYSKQYGYFVIQVQATKPAGTQPFSKVQTEIQSGLQQQKQDALFQTFSNNIAKKFHIKLNV